MATKRIYNLLVKRVPHHDLKMRHFAQKVKLPSLIDLRPKCPSVYDQGNLGSCTSMALSAAYEYLDKNKYLPSRLFLYYCERFEENTVSSDSGALLSDGIKALETYGVCDETDWPYDVKKYAVKPPAKCYTDASKHKVVQAKNISQDLTTMKMALYSGFPIVVGISVYESFESDQAAKTGLIPVPDVNKEELLGGHAVVVVGYDDTKKNWIMRNSWGTGWGDKGYFYLPYLYLLDSNLATDLWIITSEKNL